MKIASTPAGKPDPVPVVIRPDPPTSLQGASLEAWHGLCDDLADQGALAKADRSLIEATARLQATLRAISDELDGQPLARISEANGRAFVNPLLSAQAEYASKLARCLADLGLSPKSRKTVAPPEAPDALAVFLAEGA